MCVICHAAKKRYMKRAEVQQAMKANSAGFFLMALKPDGKSRDSIRTMSEDDALKFFDDRVAEEDAFVMHARIPSRGASGIDNVHGWEEDGIVFCHNMTVTAIDDMMRRDGWSRTDSEFFFRKLFIPFMRGLKTQGLDVYSDGRFCGELDNFVEHFVGSSNKFCFIMPDNRVLRYGDWVEEGSRKEDGVVAFHASNTSYRVYEPSWGGGSGGFRSAGTGFASPYRGYYGSSIDDDDDYVSWQRDGSPDSSFGRTVVTGYGSKASREEDRYDGHTLRDAIGDSGVLRLALADIVAHNVIAFRRTLADTNPSEGPLMDAIELDLLPSVFSDGTFDSANEMLEWLAGPDTDLETYELAIDCYATEAETLICKAANHGVIPFSPSKDRIIEGLETYERELGKFLLAVNLHLDWAAETAEDFAYAFYMSRSRKGKPCMERAGTVDLICPESMKYEDAKEAVETILDQIRIDEDTGEEGKVLSETGKGDAA